MNPYAMQPEMFNLAQKANKPTKHEQRRQSTDTALDNLDVGTEIRLQGLKTGKQYNGRHGRIIEGFNITKARYSVELIDPIKQLSVRPINICVVHVRIPGTTSNEVAEMIRNNSAPSYLKGLAFEEELKDAVRPVGADNITDLVWKRMHRVLNESMNEQLNPSHFTFKPMIHRFPDIFPYDFNAMPEYIGSWMGDCFGLMHWPLPGDYYNTILQQIVTENNVGIIVALGKQEANQRVEMVSYWKTLGKNYTEKNQQTYIIREVTGIGHKRNSCTLYQFPQWPDRVSPKNHSDTFNFLFEKISEVEKSGKKVLVHCRAGVGRSGTLRLMYKTWSNQLRTDGLVSAMNKQRALRKYAVQTKVQYNFLQEYIRTFEKKKSLIKSFQDIGSEAFDRNEFPEAAYWFFMYQYYGLGTQKLRAYRNLERAISRCPENYADTFVAFLRQLFYSEKLQVNSKWEKVKTLWANQEQDQHATKI